MQVDNLYTSVACNRCTECADWGPNGLIAYGACNAVAVMDPKFNGNSAKILFTLVEHTKRVNTVKWLNEERLLSGGDDGNAVLWKVDDSGATKHVLLKGHTSGVNAVHGVARADCSWLLATAAADSSIRLWSYLDGVVTCVQTIQLSAGGFCFSLRLTLLPSSDNVLLAFSGDDESVSLYAEQAEATGGGDSVGGEFQRVHKLSGHEDWVRGLDFVYDGEDLLLASGSQDNFIRLWRIAPRSEEQMRENRIDLLQMSDSEAEIKVEEKILQLGERAWYAVSLESVLYGHEEWVYGVHWHKTREELRLLSASIDKTLIVWAPTEDGVWLEQVRVGEVGGNSMGFFGGKFSHDGHSIVGHSYQGGFHIWNQDRDRPQLWSSNVIVGGHYGEVRDLAWEHDGAYLMTVSADQTTRLHAPWLQDDPTDATWHELARPQIHGYDMQALALLSRYKFASGAEEKIVRTFQAPANFIENFRNISRVESDEAGDALLDSLPKGASVPSLGLSNKAVYKVDSSAAAEETGKGKNEYPESYFVPITLKTPPQEETLMQNTLWPEMQKLYGHGYEIFALAATADGSLLASTCKASNAEHAQIILWNPSNWKQLQKLSGHQLTVTQLSFSPDARYLVSVSRDRRWCLYEKQQDSTAGYQLVASTDKSNGVHTRIIWSCDWSHDGQFFVTSSRDGKVVAWQKGGDDDESSKESSASLNGWRAAAVLELKNESITAVAFSHDYLIGTSDTYIVALGTESGLIKIYQLVKKEEWKLLAELNKDQAHHLTVRRLQFRPGQKLLQLASCGEDHLVRIYNLRLTAV